MSPNPYKRCPDCHFNHRPGRCKVGVPGSIGDAGGNPSPGSRASVDLKRISSTSAAIIASDLTRLLGNLGIVVYRDPFSQRAEGITRQAILRADTHGMDHYGPAPASFDEKRDLYQETIEELLDAIYYLTRQVARLEDLRGGVAGLRVPPEP